MKNLRNMHFIALAALILAVTGCTATTGSSANAGKNFGKYIKSKSYVNNLNAALSQTEAKEYSEICVKQGKQASRYTMLVQSAEFHSVPIPPLFMSYTAETPSSGEWLEHFDFRDCGLNKTVSLRTTVRSTDDVVIKKENLSKNEEQSVFRAIDNGKSFSSIVGPFGK